MPMIWRISIILILAASGYFIWLWLGDESQDVVATTNWFVTSPDIELNGVKNAHIVITFQSNVADDLTFNDSPTFQLWSGSDDKTFDFVEKNEVTINQEPSGLVSPGNTFSYDLAVKLNDVDSDEWEGHIAIRPRDDNLYGTLGPNKVSVVGSEVTFTDD